MHLFRVWAPRASRVELVIADARLDLEPRVGGWWELDVPEAGHGTDYAFSLDGADPLPDPRSAWQPAGVHGPSRVYDPSPPAGRGPYRGRSVLGEVFYELHVGTFTPTGTLDAAIERLDDLVSLGVDVVEPLPLAAFDGVHGWGYDGVDLFAVHEPYGGPAALRRFVDACHDRGLGVCLDVVYNHLGPSGNYLDRFGPYFTDRHRTPWGSAVNLDDDGAAEVRRFLCDNAAWWFEEFDVDALRLDAVHALVDDSPEHLLAQLARETRELSAKLGRPLTLIAESDLNDPTVLDPVDPRQRAIGGPDAAQARGWGIDAQWSDDFHHALHATLTGETSGYYVDFFGVDLIARTLTRVFRHDGEVSAFRGRPWGRPVDPQRHRGHRFFGYLQDHDQVGNRAVGDRHPALISVDRLAVGAALLLTSPFTPMLFMGEEWAASTPWQFFTSFPDQGLGAAVRDGRRAEFSRHGWAAEDVPDPQDPDTWRRSVLRWDERGAGDHARILDWYRRLIALRRAEPDLRDDDLRRISAEVLGEGGLVVRRGAFVVVVNLGERPLTLDPARTAPDPGVPGSTVPGSTAPDPAVPVLTWGEIVSLDGVVTLPPETVAVLRATGGRARGGQGVPKAESRPV